MAPPSGSPALSGQIPSITSSPTSKTPQRVSSQAAASSVTTPSRANSPSSPTPASTSIRSQTHSTTSSTSFVPSPSISATHSSQIPSTHSTDARVTPLLHRPGIIAAIVASTTAVFLFILLALFLHRRRRARQKRLDAINSHDESFLQYSRGEDEAKGWKDSARSTAGADWTEESPPWAIPIPLRAERVHARQSVNSFSGKGPHYTVRSRPSTVGDVYGFGQDVAWQEAHYEDPLPALDSPDRASYPPIDVTPPTPSSAIIHHNMASAVPLLRGHSVASSISSQYSTASITPEAVDTATSSTRSPAIILDQPRNMENRETGARTQEYPPGGMGRLV
ncbi:hypothetical protein C8R44DRAFT_767231 [Mycena epipterygia]|nr:hypothetical protein C8R44DRAFT_767231 [Mycena epipterygia]